MASVSCIEHMAPLVKDNIVNSVCSFFVEKYKSVNWFDRYVSLLAFGAIMDGPDNNYMLQVFSPVYNELIQMIADPSPKVRCAAAYFMRRVIEHQP